MSNDTMVTLQGWLGGDPTGRDAGGVPVTHFRVGCTPRRFHRQREEWVDGETQWYTVNAWRTLAEHCLRSLRRGDPVVVHGRLTHRTYVNKANTEVLALEVEAITVGHDLTRGCSAFSRSPLRDRADGSATPEATAA
ncbi:single-stranded DNA-binding protein [Nocardioides sp. YIM 152588]|uniref:single-stranded DNA-binding protein n=1 Tax=Nocardioides sp. YIM 152588 TaxID=3158259 RepID=UPI0032E38E43